MHTLRDLLEIFGRAGRLLVRHWPSLLFWGLLGGALFRLSMQAAVWANGWTSVPAWVQSVLALALLGFALLSKIGASVAMFFSLRGSMPGLGRLRFLQRETDRLIALGSSAQPGRHARRRDGAAPSPSVSAASSPSPSVPPAHGPGAPPHPGSGGPAPASAPQRAPSSSGNAFEPVLPDLEPRFLDSLLVATVPFLVLYVAWDFIERYINDLGYEAMQRLEGAPIVGKNLVFGFLFAAGVAWVVKFLLGGLENRAKWSQPLWRVLGVYFEAAYLIFTFLIVDWLWDKGPPWLASRVVVARAGELWSDIVENFPPAEILGTIVSFLWGFWGEVQAGLLVPFVWLAITAVVYGHVLDREREVVARSRFLQQFENRFQRLPGEVRFLLDHYSGGPREKWVPIVNAIRLIWGAGPMLLIVYTLAFVVLRVGLEWAVVGVTYLIGPHEAEFWIPAIHLMEDVPMLLTSVFQICLLAGTFDVILIRRSEAAARESETAARAAEADAARLEAARATWDGQRPPHAGPSQPPVPPLGPPPATGPGPRPGYAPPHRPDPRLNPPNAPSAWGRPSSPPPPRH